MPCMLVGATIYAAVQFAGIIREFFALSQLLN
jgi:hypothetical protein